MENSKTEDFTELTERCSTGISIHDFSLLKVLGIGSYGKVMLVRKNETGELLAMKILKKEHLIQKNQVVHTMTERKVLETIHHPFIVNLKYAFQNPKKLYLLLEYCPGGELFFHLQKSGKFDEDRARFYAGQILLAIKELHKNDIIYHDLKPENILIDSEGYVKLTDFGSSKVNMIEGQTANTLCGTPEYLAPEILKKKPYGKPIDWWSFGAVVFEMITGLPPFYSRDRERLFYNIKYNELKFPSYVGVQCKDLLMKLLIKDPTNRLGTIGDADEIMSHPWFNRTDWIALEDKKLMPEFKPKRLTDTDTGCFDQEFTSQPAADSVTNQVSMNPNEGKWEGFSYDGSSIIDNSSPTE